MLSINTNIISLNAQNNLSNTQSALGTSLARLSSGLRINSAADDAAGYAIANRFTAQINGLNQATRNANDGVSLAQTANGGLQSIQNNLQTIRNLAVQSANGSNSSIDRASLQAQATQLLQEIDRVAKTTQFNGVNLLDGSFSSQFQVGSNVGQTVNIGIGSAQTKDLGTGATSAVTMDGMSVAAGSSAATLKYGDLVINGTTVNAPTANMDNASSTMASNSAIAKAAAINAVSAQTGVTATVETNTMGGANMATGSTVGTTGTLTINGVSIGTVAAGASNASTRSSIMAAINAQSAYTGVVATDSGQDATGITLTAVDGRNINVSQSASDNLKLDKMGLTGGTHIGGVALQSTSAINLTSNTANTGTAGVGATATGLQDWGLTAGNYTAGTAYVSATGTGTTTALQSGDVTINGISVGASLASSDTASYTLSSASAIAKAGAINAISAQTGVTAVANANTVVGGTLAAGATNTPGGTATMTLNGVSIGTFTTSGNATADRDALINQINQYSGQTGVVASVDNTNGGLDLTAADGRNIDINAGANDTMVAGDVGLTTSIYTKNNDKVQVGTVSLKSASAITVGTTTSTGTKNLGIDVGTYGSVKSGVALSRMDISTVSGANTALTAIDNAIGQVNSQAGALGAYQNRFTATVSNLQATAQNLTAARSQIQDTDFASETANLSKSQILQQAGTAMLAQANQMGQSVLSLLK